MADWTTFLSAMTLVLVRVSGMVAFAPFFSSNALPIRTKAVFVGAVAFLLAPLAATLPAARSAISLPALLSELAVGLVYGLALAMMMETLLFAGQICGLQFSFSLVNLLDPNSMIETAVLGQMLSWLGVLVIIGSGLDRSLLAAVVRSFSAVPVGQAVMQAKTGVALAMMAGGIFLAGVQLAAPVMAAALAVEVTVALVARLSPQLPSLVISVPAKTMVSYVVLIASLAVWPGWIERHFTTLLDAAAKLLVRA